MSNRENFAAEFSEKAVRQYQIGNHLNLRALSLACCSFEEWNFEIESTMTRVCADNNNNKIYIARLLYDPAALNNNDDY